jgi:glyoxalase-like protein
MIQIFSRRKFLAVTGGALVGPSLIRAAEDIPISFDHMVLGIDDLDRGISLVEERVGVRAVFGGLHPDRGTQNALLSFGGQRYFEIIAPDPKQTVTPQFPEISHMREPRLVAWAVHTTDIAALAKKISDAGFAIQRPADGSRARPDGKLLRWKSFRLRDDRGGLLPFFIEWSRDSVHPSVDAPAGSRLERLFAVGPEPKDLAAVYQRLEVEIAIERGEKARLRARIAGPKGEVEFSS